MPVHQIFSLTDGLSKLKTTIHQVTSQTGTFVILKTIIDSNEHQFLQYFSGTSEKINFSYYILLHLITFYSSYFGGKKGISGNKTSFFLLMAYQGAIK